VYIVIVVIIIIINLQRFFTINCCQGNVKVVVQVVHCSDERRDSVPCLCPCAVSVLTYSLTDFVQVSSQSHPGLPVRAVHASRPSRRTTAPLFGQPPPTRRAKNTARHVRPSCVRRGWSDHLERTRPRSQHRQLRSPTEDASVSAALGSPSALEALCDNAMPYKLTLTYCYYIKLQ